MLASKVLSADSTLCKFGKSFWCLHVIFIFREGNLEEAFTHVEEAVALLQPSGNTWREKGNALLEIDIFSANVHPQAAVKLAMSAEVWCEWQSQENAWTIMPGPDRFNRSNIIFTLLSSGTGKHLLLPRRG